VRIPGVDFTRGYLAYPACAYAGRSGGVIGRAKSHARAIRLRERPAGARVDAIGNLPAPRVELPVVRKADRAPRERARGGIAGERWPGGVLVAGIDRSFRGTGQPSRGAGELLQRCLRSEKALGGVAL